jgi:hypothetical protein
LLGLLRQSNFWGTANERSLRLEPLCNAPHRMVELDLGKPVALGDRLERNTGIVGVPVRGGSTITIRRRAPDAEAIWAPRWSAVHPSARASKPTHTVRNSTGSRSASPRGATTTGQGARVQ